ncbi:putative ABC transport system permease protein [Actinomadura meyerae]|uniref:Putative ABC transport system permease protein n=1 Tax=Actinomadura meyerae TaxID=240840 RepID=A0A239FAC9_9ACTN|nr:FtsX-like permease family protein [Actinomadura meyerae]SNS53777.1 putative ABC transport system permease protein [Actinomadura meyerae]
MGSVLLVLRLVLADLRRHPGPAAMLLVAITAATATLALGLSLHGATDSLYRQTREATAGPDMVALTPGADPSPLTGLLDDPQVVAHSGPHRQYYTTLAAHGLRSRAVVLGAPASPGPVDRPLVTSGTWVRPGGVVVERGFAAALGVRAGDRVTVAGRSLPVVGTAVTAASTVYPGAQLIGPGDGPVDYSGLVWMGAGEARALAAAERLEVTSLIYLKLRDPAATEEFMAAHHDPAVRPFTWQFMAAHDARVLRDSQPILVIGSWLLSFLAVAGVATLAAGRAAEQTRRVGLLKAVGAAPGLIAAVLFAEYLAVALAADALGLGIARLAVPAAANPTASLLSASAGPSADTAFFTTVVALAMAALTTLGPTLRALRTPTVAALSDTARRPVRRSRLTRVSARLPTPLLLGLRLVARRPGRAVLHASTIAVTVMGMIALLFLYAQPDFSYGLGSTDLANVRVEQGRHMLLAVTIGLIALAAVDTVTVTWTTALEARPTMAVARTLGATPGQVTAGLAAAQLLPALPGALAGIPFGVFVCWLFSTGETPVPPTWELFAVALAALPVTAALTAVPARVAARRPIARTLSTEAP